MNNRFLLLMLGMVIIAFAFCSCDADFWNGSGSGGNVSYDSNGADYGTAPSPHSRNLNVQQNIGNLEKNGYCFDCWNTSRDGSGRDYFPGSSSPDGGVLYAKWAPVFMYRASGSALISERSSSSSGSGSYLHITGVTDKGKTLSELKVTTTIDGCAVTGIDNGAFKSCTNAKSITLSQNIVTIGDGAFAGCNSLENLIMLGSEPPAMGAGVLDSCPATICVPPNAKSAYSSKEGWNTYSSKIVEYYTVSFDSQGATIAAYPYTIRVISPATTVETLPSQPVRGGYSFAGWYTGIDGNGSLFIENTKVKGNMTVYAKWEKESQASGVKISFDVISFSDARVPSHLFDNVTPEETATYYYKATPRWTSDLRSVRGATLDYVQIPNAYSVNTLRKDMGYFTPGIWDFSVKVVSENGVTLYRKDVNSCNVTSNLKSVEFDLEKDYSGIGKLVINADLSVSDANQGEDNKLVLSYSYSGSADIYTESFNNTTSIHKELSLPPGFYLVSLSHYDRTNTDVGRRTGYIEVFADETSTLNGTVEEGKWVTESYSAIVSNKFPFEERKKLGIILETVKSNTDNRWTFTATKTIDSEDIKKYSWYVTGPDFNGAVQNETSNVFVLNVQKSGNYNIKCIAIDSTQSFFISASFAKIIVIP